MLWGVIFTIVGGNRGEGRCSTGKEFQILLARDPKQCKGLTVPIAPFLCVLS